MRHVATILIFTFLCWAVSAAQAPDQTVAPATAQAAPATPPATSANPSQAAVASPASSDTSVALARKYMDAWNSGDKTAIDSFSDFIMHNHGGRVVVDSAMLERVIANWRRSMPDLTFTIDDTVAQADKAVLRVTLRGTYKERLFPDTGDPQNPPRLVRATGILIFKIVNGKIQEIWQELDESLLRVQMGAQWKSPTPSSSQSPANPKSEKPQKPPTGVAPPKP